MNGAGHSEECNPRALKALTDIAARLAEIAQTQRRILRILEDCVGMMDNQRKFIRVSRLEQ